MKSIVERSERVPRDRLAELVSAATYGTVHVLAALAVIGATSLTVGQGAEIVAGVGIATWVAHLFADLLGGHVLHREPLHRREVGRAAIDGSPIIMATILPAAALVLARLDVVGDRTAKFTAIVVALLQLLLIGAFVAQVAPARPRVRWVFGGAVAAAGLVVVVLTLALGH
jgi:hypothetical protein